MVLRFEFGPSLTDFAKTHAALIDAVEKMLASLGVEISGRSDKCIKCRWMGKHVDVLVGLAHSQVKEGTVAASFFVITRFLAHLLTLFVSRKMLRHARLQTNPSHGVRYISRSFSFLFSYQNAIRAPIPAPQRL